MGDPEQVISGLAHVLQAGAVSWMRLLEAAGWAKGAGLPPVTLAPNLPHDGQLGCLG